MGGIIDFIVEVVTGGDEPPASSPGPEGYEADQGDTEYTPE